MTASAGGAWRRGDRPITPASAWQNAFAEPLIGSIRREWVDQVLVLGEVHLRRVLKSYADYYNNFRTHRSLNKDAPVSRPVQRIGSIKSHAILRSIPISPCDRDAVSCQLASINRSGYYRHIVWMTS
jgi:Integrase core domain